MDTGLIARRYARALADFAESNGEMTRTAEEAAEFIETYNRIGELRQAFISPVLEPDAKVAVVRQAMGGTLSQTLEGFLRLVIRHHRETLPRLSTGSHLRRAMQIIVLMQTQQRLADTVMRQQHPRIARILAANTVNRLQHGQSPARNILAVTDRQPHKTHGIINHGEVKRAAISSAACRAA